MPTGGKKKRFEIQICTKSPKTSHLRKTRPTLFPVNRHFNVITRIKTSPQDQLLGERYHRSDGSSRSGSETKGV